MSGGYARRRGERRGRRAGLETLLERQKIEYELVEDRHGQVSADKLKLVQ